MISPSLLLQTGTLALCVAGGVAAQRGWLHPGESTRQRGRLTTVDPAKRRLTLRLDHSPILLVVFWTDQTRFAAPDHADRLAALREGVHVSVEYVSRPEGNVATRLEIEPAFAQPRTGRLPAAEAKNRHARP